MELKYRVNFVTPPRGAPAPTPADQMRQTLGTDIPQFWSRIFAVASGRVGKNYMGMEIFNRFLNTVSKGHFVKIMKQAIYDPAFAKTLAGTVKGGKLSVGDLKEMYGFLATARQIWMQNEGLECCDLQTWIIEQVEVE